jgi:hypothetical protein
MALSYDHIGRSPSRSVPNEEVTVGCQNLAQLEPCRQLEPLAVEDPLGISTHQEWRHGEAQLVKEVGTRQLRGHPGPPFGQHVGVTELSKRAHSAHEIDTVVAGHDHVGHLGGADSVSVGSRSVGDHDRTLFGLGEKR